MDISLGSGDWWGQPAYGNVTLENNVFGHSTNGGTGWHYYGLAWFIGKFENARVVNNTFENEVAHGDPAHRPRPLLRRLGQQHRRRLAVPARRHLRRQRRHRSAAPPTSPSTRASSCGPPACGPLTTMPVGWVNPSKYDFHLKVELDRHRHRPARSTRRPPTATARAVTARPDAGAYEYAGGASPSPTPTPTPIAFADADAHAEPDSVAHPDAFADPGAGHDRPVGPAGLHDDRRDADVDQPEVEPVVRQRRRHGLPPVPRRRPEGHHDEHELHVHRPDLRQELRDVGDRGRRRRQRVLPPAGGGDRADGRMLGLRARARGSSRPRSSAPGASTRRPARRWPTPAARATPAPSTGRPGSPAARTAARCRSTASTTSCRSPTPRRLDLTKGMTLEAWVRPASTSGYRTALFKEHLSARHQAYSLYATTSSSRPGTEVSTGSGYKSAISSQAVTTDAWTHLAATYDGTTLRLFRDGAEVASKPLTSSFSDHLRPAQDRRQRRLERVVPGPHRRRPRLQHGPVGRRDPGGHDRPIK